jgi:hypothetical protein
VRLVYYVSNHLEDSEPSMVDRSTLVGSSCRILSTMAKLEFELTAMFLVRPPALQHTRTIRRNRDSRSIWE